jgi:RNA polymerase sigma-70 factor (ECF subfamily)
MSAILASPPSLAEMLGDALAPRGWIRQPNEGVAPAEDAWSDQALIDAIVKRGSQHHFRALMERHKHRVHHIALSVLGPGQDAGAQDVTQDVFVRLHERLGSYRGESSFTTWLYRLAFNQAIDQQRRNKRHAGVPLELVPEPVSVAEPTDDAVMSQVRSAVNRLPQTQRIMVHLHYWLGFRMREIAEVLGCPENTVKVYVSRARARLADDLGVLSDD